jgi:hypothetical protein
MRLISYVSPRLGLFGIIDWPFTRLGDLLSMQLPEAHPSSTSDTALPASLRLARLPLRLLILPFARSWIMAPGSWFVTFLVPDS